MDSNTGRILLVDDHPSIRSALKDYLSRKTDLRVVGEVGRGSDIPAAVERYRPDLVVLDLELEPGFDLETAIARIRKLAPKAKIAVYSGHSEAPLVERVTNLVVDGYIHKTEKMNIVVHAIEGRPHEVIADLARRVHASLIVVGRHGPEPVHDLLVGSTTTRLLHVADGADVLVTPVTKEHPS